MAQRRMFSMKIVDTDRFLDMPQSAQLLYFHLSMRADDEGFVPNPKKIMRAMGNNDDDLKILFAKNFLIGFETGIVVIRDWRIHNYIAKDRFTETHCKDERSQLVTDENGSYTKCIQITDNMKTQVRLGKERLGKDKESRFAPPSQQSVKEYLIEQNIKSFTATQFIDYYEARGWMIGKNKMKDWKAAVRTWKNRETKEAAKPSMYNKLTTDIEQ